MFINFFLWLMSIMFLFLNHPLSFGLILLIQTTLISLITGNMNYNYWFSYILFLIMIGGMLILFIYMTSIASNEKFKFSIKLFYLFMIMLILTSTLIFTDNFFMNFLNLNYNLTESSSLMLNQLSMSKYTNYPTNMIYFMMIIYLFITLIVIVKITEIKFGPLRQKF
uniref:NADH-ubiquinone oxidoreductase chain 6 n=1 Tax=Doydirhynchus austriacus TaxID=166863 RepID=J9PGT7_9CUCU|nr:NADH dehydrogenase subunit 6 [Doydirhynchus austriacus]